MVTPEFPPAPPAPLSPNSQSIKPEQINTTDRWVEFVLKGDLTRAGII